jgi:hypothetical protein
MPQRPKRPQLWGRQAGYFANEPSGGSARTVQVWDDGAHAPARKQKSSRLFHRESRPLPSSGANFGGGDCDRVTGRNEGYRGMRSEALDERVRERAEELLDLLNAALSGTPPPSSAPSRSTLRTCAVDDCQRVADARNLCSLHYRRLRRRGDPLVVHSPGRPPLHGHASVRSGTYTAWLSLRKRVSDSRRRGDRLRVCKHWEVFENFLADMGARPPRHALGLIDPRRGYEPGNCRWTPLKSAVARKESSAD